MFIAITIHIYLWFTGIVAILFLFVNILTGKGKAVKPHKGQKTYTVTVTGNPEGARIALARIWASAVIARRKSKKVSRR